MVRVSEGSLGGSEGSGGFGSLGLLPPGETGRVAGLVAEGLVRRRLLDLGFVPGTVVRAVLRSPFGDPTAYGVRGSVIALRREDADGIIIGPDG